MRTHTRSFATALRGAMREDHDVIMVGEMRDLETIALAVTASETGHLVLGTLHTGGAARTLDRVLDVFPVDQREQIRVMVSESLRGIVSQQLVPRADGTGRAPDFPFGCFDGDKRLGPESFVPGYTQVYTFADERQNENPEVLGLTLNGEDVPEEEDFDKLPVVKACPLTEDERRNPGCDQSAREACTEYTIKGVVDPSIGEVDPDATGEEGGTLTEAVWISYFVDRGDIAPGVKLVNDAVAGFNPNIATSFLPPAEAGFATIWAVIRDARGGTGVIKRMVRGAP